MITARPQAESPVARSVREALSSVLAPEHVRLVLDMALMFAQLGAVPEEADRARTFIQGSLRRALDSYVGADTAEEVIQGLEPILAMMGSHVRTRSLEELAEVRGDDKTPLLPSLPPLIAEERLVLVSSLDRTSIQGLACHLFEQARVRQIRNVFDLFAAVEAHDGPLPLIVVDCSLPAVDPMTLATMLPDPIHGATVVLWGATRRQRDELEREAPVARDWIPCPSTTGHEQLADLLLDVL